MKLKCISSFGRVGSGSAFCAVMAAAVSLFPTVALSQTITSWIDGSGKWETATNWSGGVAPSTNYIAFITNATTKTVTFDFATIVSDSGIHRFVSNLTVSASLNSTNTLLLNAGGLTVRGHLDLINNSTILMTNNGGMQIRSLSMGGSGSGNQIIATNGSQLVTIGGGGSVIGGVTSSNNSVVLMAGSAWFSDGSFNILNSAPGIAIKVTDNSSVIVSNLFLGNSTTANGNIIIVTDPFTQWFNTGTLTVGGPCQGAQFIVSNGAEVASSRVVIGDPAGSNHTAIVTGSNSLWSVSNTMQVGAGGIGDRMTIAAGGLLNVSNASHTALLTVNGATLSLNGGNFRADNLIVTNGGVVQLGQSFLVDKTTFTISSGSVQAGSNLLVGSTANSTGTVNVTGGSLVVTNGALGIGNSGTVTSGSGFGSMTVSNAAVTASTILLGSSAGGQGELILANGGTISSAGTNPVLVVNGFDQIGGDLAWSSGTMYCGYAHPGAYTLANGTATCQDMYVGYDNAGTMTIAGGAISISSRLTVGHLASPVSTGSVWVTGGQLTMLSLPTIIGNSGVGQMTLSNGTVTVPTMIVGNGSNPGSLTVAGGALTVLSSLTVGDCGGGMTGTVTITGGNLFVTNAAHNATLDVRNRSVTLNSGLLKVDRLVMTNTCGLFIRGGGTLDVTTFVLDPNLDADSDGIPNGWEQSHGLDPLNAADAGTDNDGDGLSNLREFQLGTDPVNPSSPYRITAVVREGINMRVTWTTVGGQTNVVQVSPGTANGSYNNNFGDLSGQLIIPGSTVTSTNYLDSNGATNSPSRYYRIRVP